MLQRGASTGDTAVNQKQPYFNRLGQKQSRNNTPTTTDHSHRQKQSHKSVMSHHQLKFGYVLSKSMGNTTTNTTKMARLMPIMKLAKSNEPISFKVWLRTQQRHG